MPNIYQRDRIRTCVTMFPKHVTDHLAYTLLFYQDGWTRTSDPSRPRRALYQLSYILWPTANFL